MSKYDFKIDVSDKSSTGLIIGEIERGAVVLEFGCAFGRMTRYMKEELSCKVYIVEYDAEAFNAAIQYAEDGICDDIQTLSWVERFKGISFDAIIFADVLEHLQCPEKIVEKAAELLNDTGKIYISIPNITHNDVLLKAYDERFDYTSIGILDDTHVHFWGLKNIYSMAEYSGLFLSKITATYCETGCTEQFAEMKREENILLENLLRERQCGEVYQFIVTLDKCKKSDFVMSVKEPAIKCLVYIDAGSDFSADGCTEVYAVRSENGSYHVHYEIKNTSKIKRVRLDPVENQNCIVQNISFRQGNKELGLICSSHDELENGYIFIEDDPMIYVEIEENGNELVIDADIFIWSEGYLRLLQRAYMNVFANMVNEISQKNALTEINAALQEMNAALQKMNEDMRGEYLEEISKQQRETVELREVMSRVNRENSELHNTIKKLREEIEQCRVDLGTCNWLAYKKDAYALRLKKTIADLEKELNEKNEYIEKLNRRRFIWRKGEKRYRDMWIFKPCVFVYRAGKKVWNRIKNIGRR